MGKIKAVKHEEVKKESAVQKWIVRCLIVLFIFLLLCIIDKTQKMMRDQKLKGELIQPTTTNTTGVDISGWSDEDLETYMQEQQEALEKLREENK